MRRVVVPPVDPPVIPEDDAGSACGLLKIVMKADDAQAVR